VCRFTVAATGESVGPRNIAVINGSSATFHCIIHAPQSQVCWNLETISPEKYTRLYLEGNLTSACDNNKCNVTFDNETDRYTLTVNSVQPYHGGFYDCERCRVSYTLTAQLIVIHPIDHYDTEGIQHEYILHIL